MKVIITLFAFALATTGFTQEDALVSKDKFAYGYSIEVDGDGAIYSLYLNEKIYQGMTREDRGDLRIFNSVGNVVPHVIRSSDQMSKKAVPAIRLPFFPLYKKSKVAAANSNIRITTNDQGSIIDLNYGKADKKSQFVYAYIIDASALTVVPERFELAWESDNNNFILNIKLEGSDDLNQWHIVKPSSAISNMQFNNHTLVQREIDLPMNLPKYIRLSWLGDADFKLTGLTAHFSDSYQTQTRHWSEFMPVDIDKTNMTYFFETKSVLPADRLNIDLPAKNALVNVLIESASAANGPWYSRYHGLLYDMIIDNTRLANPVIHQAVTSHRYWRVQVLNNGGDFGGLPKLRLGWIPEQLLFVASGESPFTLTYGSARLGPATAPLAMLLSESSILQKGNLIKSAKLGAAIDFGNQSRLLPPRPETDWKKYILWSVLMAGVLLLAFMAFRLFKQMDQADKNA